MSYEIVSLDEYQLIMLILRVSGLKWCPKCHTYHNHNSSPPYGDQKPPQIKLCDRCHRNIGSCDGHCRICRKSKMCSDETNCISRALLAYSKYDQQLKSIKTQKDEVHEKLTKRDSGIMEIKYEKETS